MTLGSWELALDEIERSLDPSLDGLLTEPWEPPADLGRPPAHLSDRARWLLAELDRRIASTTAEQGEIRREIDRLARPTRPRADVAPSRFDRLA